MLSSLPVAARYLKAGARLDSSRLRTASDGPVGYQNPSQGLDMQQWRMWLRDFQFWMEADNLPEHSILPNPCSLVTDVSFCFNQNGDLHLLYTEQELSYFCWYDTITATMQVMQLPEGTRSARITLDDKRASQSARSDIILSYLDANGALKHRKQRDRFEVEYLLDEGPYISLEKLYMNVGYRLQWECVVGTWVPTPPIDVMKPYVRYLLTPRVHADYTGFISGEFDTGRVVPDNQTLDTYRTTLTGMYWTADKFIVQYSGDVSPAEVPYCYVYVNGLQLKAFNKNMQGTTFEADLTSEDITALNSLGHMAIQVCVLFPDTINATQEF